MGGDDEGGGGAFGLAALLLVVLIAGAALLLTTSPSRSDPGQAPVPAEAGCEDGSPGSLFGLVCPDGH
ncbi:MULTISPECIES: hypothetical protein [Pseudonocardia]|uniref:Uncharacterized protein n=2 Tax=Pseudonocardia TaxID=1847 RepID=A0A1Y2N722_PSEAH|nr:MULTISPECIES: hypothetical protein [Pseudonocardia]OSY43260.1 hypothetical protein BG845_00865 [Pseudonocardia autotrophica]TDN71748.1 hypothetical protein C8E95_0782 [Pseudonocardia autotrophica]BBG02435.1 hypothetical protein Pdca_36440 [Pseudonocardia autotrophica]GEC23229.1 hypothetical protein PSA01_02580 [Pseudonocardia saturnea]